MTVKKALLVLLMLALLSQQTASSFVPPPATNWLFNRSIASILKEVATRRGLPATDPRIAATNNAISSNLTALNVASAGVGIGLTMLGAPVWLTVLAGLGVAGAGSAVVAYLGKDKIQIGDDGYGRVSVKVPKSQQTKIDQTSYPGMTGSGFTDHWSVRAAQAGFRVYRDDGCLPSEPCSRFPKGARNDAVFSGGKLIVALPSLATVASFITFMSSRFDGKSALRNVTLRPEQDMDGNVVKVHVDYTYDTILVERQQCDPNDKTGADGQSIPKPGMCEVEKVKAVNGSKWIFSFGGSGEWPGRFWSVERLYEREQPSTAQNWYDSLERAYIGMPKDIQSAPVASETLAKVVDTAWRRAASRPGYEGVPYSVTRPVTSAEVDSWAKANPELVPRVEDLFRPAGKPGERTVVIQEVIKPRVETRTDRDTKVEPKSEPDTDTATDTKTPTETQLVKDVNVINRPTVDIGHPVKVDLGTAPMVEPPRLETPPTASTVLKPILSLFPDIKKWTVPKHAAECPRPTFDLFGQRIRMDAMCDIAEKHRRTITTVMFAVFVLIALMIVLAA